MPPRRFVRKFIVHANSAWKKNRMKEQRIDIAWERIDECVLSSPQQSQYLRFHCGKTVVAQMSTTCCPEDGDLGEIYRLPSPFVATGCRHGATRFATVPWPACLAQAPSIYVTIRDTVDSSAITKCIYRCGRVVSPYVNKYVQSSRLRQPFSQDTNQISLSVARASVYILISSIIIT